MSAKLHRRSSSADNISTDDELPAQITRSRSRKFTKKNLKQCLDISSESESQKSELEEDFIYSEITPTLPIEIKRKSLGIVNK